jgi:hypothetical protein
MDADNGMDMAGTPELQESEPPAAANVGGDGSPTSQTIRGDGPEKTDKHFKVQFTRFGRKTKPVSRLVDAIVAEVENLTSGDIPGELFCLQAMFPADDQYDHVNPLLAH